MGTLRLIGRQPVISKYLERASLTQGWEKRILLAIAIDPGSDQPPSQLALNWIGARAHLRRSLPIRVRAALARSHMGQLQKIDHIVVLMLENRSFDSLLGELYPKSSSFEGLAGNEQNPDADGAPVVVWNGPGTDETTMRIPNPDPGELWTDINTQLFSNSAPASGQTPSINGFVKSYLKQKQLNPQEKLRSEGHDALFYAEPSAGTVVARRTIRDLRLLVRVSAVPDLVQPLVRPCGQGRPP